MSSPIIDKINKENEIFIQIIVGIALIFMMIFFLKKNEKDFLLSKLRLKNK